MSAAQSFPTLDVVSVTTGLLVSDRGVDGLYELMGFVLNDSLMTHQLPAASRACEPLLFEQHPWLADLDPPGGDRPALKAWCAQLVADRGRTMQVKQVEGAEWKRGNALVDLADMAAGRPVIGVQLEP